MSCGSSKPVHPLLIPNAGGEMRERIRAYDWGESSLGPPERWPDVLQSLVGVMLNASQPMHLAWGPELVLLYNDAFSALLNEKHPWALGNPLLDVWAEYKEELAPLVNHLQSGEPVQVEDFALMVRRGDSFEQAHFCLHYTPVSNGVGGISGFFCNVTNVTPYVLANRDLSEKLEKRQRLFKQAPGFTAFLAGPEHIFEFANTASSKLFGEREYIGKSVRDVFPELVAQGTYRRLDQVYRTGQRHRAEGIALHLQSSGETKPIDLVVDFVYEPIRDEADRVIGVFVEGYDVTDRERAQEALRTSEKMFRALAQTMPSHAWMAKADGRVHWFNDSCYEYYGVAPGELFGRGLAQRIHPDDLSVLTAKWAACVTSGEKFEIEKRMRRADGAYRWHLVRAVPLRDEDGTIILWIGTSTDIEDQKRVAEHLSQLNEELGQRVNERTAEYDRVWGNSRDLLMVLGADGICQAVNPAWAEILGYKPEEVIGHSFLEFIWPDDLELTRNAHEEALLNRQLTGLEKRYRHKDGTFRWISWNTATQNDRVYGYGRDITEQKAQAEALRQSEERLHQAQKMEAVGQLTSGISHDFNNLLGGITGALQLICTRLAEGRTEKLEGYAKGAMESAQRAAGLVQRLLAFSRRQPIDPKIVDIGQELAGMEELIRRTIPHHAFELIVEQGIYPVRCDPNQLASSVLNLAINARDAMPDGGTLLIEAVNTHFTQLQEGAQNESARGECVAIRVTDTGTGIPVAIRERILEPFFTTKPYGQGTGLGLSMVYGFAQQSAGQVNLESEENIGTTVTIVLPRYK